MRLFDEYERTDATPARYAEASFTFLNRSASASWATIREQLERWFAEYAATAPSAKALDLQRRFQSSDPAQHLPAWWELYLFWLLRRSHQEKRIRFETEAVSRTGRADFTLSAHDADHPDLTLEAAATFTGIVDSGERHGGREAVVLDAINELTSHDFFLWITFHRVSGEQPRKRDLHQRVSGFLDGLNPGDVRAAFGQTGERPRTKFSLSGWEIELAAIPKSTHREGDRLIGVGPMSSGFVNDVTKIRGTLYSKKGKYDTLGSPFVVAVMPTWPGDAVETATEVLYGREAVQVDLDTDVVTPIRQPDGLFLGRTRAVSAVLFGDRILPWTAAEVWPRLWLNPNAEQPISADLLPDVPRVHLGSDGRLVVAEPSELPARLLDIAPGTATGVS